MPIYDTPDTACPACGVISSPPYFCAGIGGIDCWIAVDALDARYDLEAAFMSTRSHPSAKPGLGIYLFTQNRLFPTLRAMRDDRRCDLGELFTKATEKRFMPLGQSSHRRYADTFFGEEPILEIAEGELIVLKPELTPYYASMVLCWLLQSDFSLIALHAAALAINDRTLLLVGPSKCGKSTLSYALQQSGAGYYGDESVFFLRPQYALYPWPRPLFLRPGGLNALGSNWEPIEWRCIKPDDPKCIVTSPVPKESCPCDKATFFFLDGFTDKPNLTPMSGGEATRRLLQGMSCAEQSIGGRLEIAADLVNRYPCYRLAVGPPHETAALLMAHMRGQG